MPRTDLLREAMKRIRRISVVVHLQALSDVRLHDLLSEVYRDTLEAITVDAQEQQPAGRQR